MIVARVLGAESVIANLGALPEKTMLLLRDDVSRLTMSLLRHVKDDKLSGQVLNVRTGTLRRLVNQQVESTPQTITGRVGVKLAYAAIHEYGGTIKMKAREAKMRFRVNAKGGLMKQQELSIGPSRMRNAGKMLVFAKAGHTRVAEKKVSIGAHTIQLPERSFLRSALADMAPEIHASIEAAVRKAVRS